MIQDLKSKGFTTLVVIDPTIHSTEETQAMLGLFEGEIRITSRETAKGIDKVIRIQKLFSQNYLKDELTLEG